MPRFDARTIRNVELARVGDWEISTGRFTVTPDDLADAERAHRAGVVRRPPLRLGHTDERPGFAPGDGEPSLGYLDNIRVIEGGQALAADLVGVPRWLADAAKVAYPDRSLEGIQGFRASDGQTYRLVLTGCALLGVTAPGIPTIRSLADVRALYSGGAVAASAGTPVQLVRASAVRSAPNPAQLAAVRVAASRRSARRAQSVLDSLEGK